MLINLTNIQVNPINHVRIKSGNYKKVMTLVKLQLYFQKLLIVEL